MRRRFPDRPRRLANAAPLNVRPTCVSGTRRRREGTPFPRIRPPAASSAACGRYRNVTRPPTADCVRSGQRLGISSSTSCALPVPLSIDRLQRSGLDIGCALCRRTPIPFPLGISESCGSEQRKQVSRLNDEDGQAPWAPGPRGRDQDNLTRVHGWGPTDRMDVRDEGKPADGCGRVEFRPHRGGDLIRPKRPKRLGRG